MFDIRKNAIKADSKWKLIGVPILILIFSSVILGAALTPVVQMILPMPEDNPASSGSAIVMALTVIITFLVMMFVAKLSPEGLGLTSKGVFFAVVKGLAGGFAAITIVAFTIYSLGGITIDYVYKPEFMPTLLWGIVFFAFQGTYEELLYRSYLMPHFSKAMGDVLAVIVSSVLFVLLHALNPGMTPMAVLNLFLASLVFSLIYYLTGNLWLVGMAHGVWNYSQGFFYGSLVSGLSLKETVFKSIPVEGKDLISGGSFGFEGGVVTSTLGIILIALFLMVIKGKQKNAEPMPAA